MKLKYVFILGAISIVFYLASCSDMNDMHQPFMDDGEVVYAAQLDSVIALAGNNRIGLRMIALSQRIDKVRIYWNEDRDSIDVQIENQTGEFFEIIPDLSEGEYIFHLVCFDKFGNKSLKYEVSSEAYGSFYSAGLINRQIDKMEYVGDDLTITWKSFANSLGTILSYENSNDEVSELLIPIDENITTISDFKSDGKYWLQSLYKPTESAIDTFRTAVVEGILPHFVKYVICDKSLFVAMSLPNDMGRLGWDDNERMERLWDGSVGPQGYPWIFHGTSSRGVITFDMGIGYDDLALVEETGRDCCGNPLVFEIWGIDDISEAATELNSTDTGWSDEMTNKGWTLLKEVVRTDDGKVPYKVELNSDVPTVRYIRVRFKETVGDQAVNLSELTFWYQE